MFLRAPQHSEFGEVMKRQLFTILAAAAAVTGRLADVRELVA